jgi:hypothetical protein
VTSAGTLRGRHQSGDGAGRLTTSGDRRLSEVFDTRVTTLSYFINENKQQGERPQGPLAADRQVDQGVPLADPRVRVSRVVSPYRSQSWTTRISVGAGPSWIR